MRIAFFTARLGNFFLLSVLAAFLVAGTGIQESSDTEGKKTEPMSQWSKLWLDQVVPYIITAAEKEYFENLTNEEERGRFIQKFWDIRDPEPETPENEFKIEHYRRVALADKYFSRSGLEGRRTERGKMFILLGPPNEIKTDSKHHGAAMTKKDTAISGGLSRYKEDPFMYGTHSGKEIWTYWDPPNPRLPPNIEFVFVDKLGTGNYVLENKVKLGEAGKKDSAYTIDTLTDLFDTITYDAEALKNPFEHRESIKGSVSTQVSYERIATSLDLYRFKGASGRTYLPFSLELPYSDISYSQRDKDCFFYLTLIITVKKGESQIVFEQSLDTNFQMNEKEYESKKQTMCKIQSAVSVESGNYVLDITIIDNLSGKIGNMREEISVPDLNDNNLAMSDIFLTLNTGTKKTSDNPIDQKAASLQKTFHPGDELNIYFEIYNLSQRTSDETSEFQVEYTFLNRGKNLASIPLPSQRLINTRDQQVETSVRLKNFPPGTYVLQAKVYDSISGHQVLKEMVFWVAR
ncbi:MAG: GWxTD domain-containing protein [Candidatus Aminicenantes bacterium]|nr:GWxTD domain-containing protein [Candidatus Aminicenantes bacterium]